MKENKLHEIQILPFRGWTIISCKTYCMAFSEEEMLAKYFECVADAKDYINKDKKNN